MEGFNQKPELSMQVLVMQVERDISAGLIQVPYLTDKEPKK